MTKNKAVLPNMQWQPIPTFDPATITPVTPETIPAGGDVVCQSNTPDAPAPKRKPTTAKKAPMRQRGLHLEDAVILKLRVEALHRGMTASRLANQILSKALAS